MCSSGDQTAKNLENSQAAMTNTLNADYSTTFAEQQQVLANLKAKMDYIAANPMGMTPQQTATATTAINENTAQAAKQAIGAAGAFAATHGGAADVGGGGGAQLAGEIATGATLSKAQSLATLSNQNELLKQQNFWSAISGLNSVGSQYGGAGGTAIGGATSTANSSTNAGQLALASQQAGWQDVGGVISGIGGLAEAGVGVAGAAKGVFPGVKAG